MVSGAPPATRMVSGFCRRRRASSESDHRPGDRPGRALAVPVCWSASARRRFTGGRLGQRRRSARRRGQFIEIRRVPVHHVGAIRRLVLFVRRLLLLERLVAARTWRTPRRASGNGRGRLANPAAREPPCREDAKSPPADPNSVGHTARARKTRYFATRQRHPGRPVGVTGSRQMRRRRASYVIPRGTPQRGLWLRAPGALYRRGPSAPARHQIRAHNTRHTLARQTRNADRRSARPARHNRRQMREARREPTVEEKLAGAGCTSPGSRACR